MEVVINLLPPFDNNSWSEHMENMKKYLFWMRILVGGCLLGMFAAALIPNIWIRGPALLILLLTWIIGFNVLEKKYGLLSHSSRKVSDEP